MNENSPTVKLKRTLKLLKERLLPKPLEDNNGPRRIAKEAVLLFAASDNQTPLQTFEANSPSTFDFDVFNPGTILRVEDEIMVGENLSESAGLCYEWVVVGEVTDDEAIAFLIHHTNDDERRKFDNRESLKLGLSWNLHEIRLPKKSFPIQEFHQIVFDIEPRFEANRPLRKVDVMASGNKIRVESEKKVRNQSLVTSPRKVFA